MKRQRGSALIVVLMIFALAFALAVEIIYRQDHVQTRTANLLDWDHRYQYAVATETLAVQALVDDFEDDQKNNELMDDCKTEKWAGPFSFPYEDATVSASVQDLQGRFNLNSLVTDNQGQFVRDAEAIARLQSLLVSVLPPGLSQYASPLANEMADWEDSDVIVNAADGAEDPDYRLNRTPNHPIASETEMRGLRSFDATLAAAINAQMQKQLAQQQQQAQAAQQATGGASASAAQKTNTAPASFWQYFTALPLGAKLNVNTAPKAVLEAYFAPYGAQAAAATIVQQRDQAPYTAVSDVLSLPALSKLKSKQRTALADLLSVNTEYFQVMIDIGTDSGVSRLVTRIKRPQQGDTKVFMRALVPVLEPLEPACNPD